MKRLFPLLVVSLLSAACGDAPTKSDVNVAEPKDAALLTAGDEVTVDAPYGGCTNTDAQVYCSAAHPGSTAISWCLYEDCFEMSYGEEVRVVAADELGAYPMTWFMWGMSDDISYSSCNLTPQKHKTRIEIPPDKIPPRCRVEQKISGQTYHEHFASVPTMGCLVWVECKAP